MEIIAIYTGAYSASLNGICPLPGFENQDVFISENTIIHPTAKIVGPVYIGENTKIGAYSTIGPNTIIGNNCIVGINNKIIASIVWDKISTRNNCSFTNIVLDRGFIPIKSVFHINIIETEVLNENIAL
jgi:mannose-1-phosphate guanylyltransferase